MKARGPGVVDANVSLQRPAQGYFLPFQRNWYREQFTAEEDQRRPAFTGPLILARVGVDLDWLFDYRNLFRIVRHLFVIAPACNRETSPVHELGTRGAYLIAGFTPTAIGIRP